MKKKLSPAARLRKQHRARAQRMLQRELEEGRELVWTGYPPRILAYLEEYRKKIRKVMLLN